MEGRTPHDDAYQQACDARDALRAENEAVIALNESLNRMSVEMSAVCYDMMMQRNASRGLGVDKLDADAARLIVDQVCDILNEDSSGGPPIVYGEVLARLAALVRERDSWKDKCHVHR